MKFAFFGTSEFSVAILEKLLSDFYRPELVITQPDKPTGRKQALTPPPIKQVCLDHNLTCMQPERLSEITEQLRRADLDLFIVASFGRIIPADILALPKIAPLNVHASLLPAYRGASPIQTAILNGEPETGISIMKMDSEVDHGDVYFRKSVPIESTTTYPSLEAKLAHTGAELLTRVLPDISSKKLDAKPQEHEKATFTKILTKEDALVDWNKSAKEVERLVRAYDGWPVAWTKLPNGLRMKVYQSSLSDQTFDIPAGTLLFEKNHAYIMCADAPLELLTVQVEGGKALTSEEFFRGYQRLNRQACRS